MKYLYYQTDKSKMKNWSLQANVIINDLQIETKSDVMNRSHDYFL